MKTLAQTYCQDKKKGQFDKFEARNTKFETDFKLFDISKLDIVISLTEGSLSIRSLREVPAIAIYGILL